MLSLRTACDVTKTCFHDFHNAVYLLRNARLALSELGLLCYYQLATTVRINDVKQIKHLLSDLNCKVMRDFRKL